MFSAGKPKIDSRKYPIIKEINKVEAKYNSLYSIATDTTQSDSIFDEFIGKIEKKELGFLSKQIAFTLENRESFFSNDSHNVQLNQYVQAYNALLNSALKVFDFYKEDILFINRFLNLVEEIVLNSLSLEDFLCWHRNVDQEIDMSLVQSLNHFPIKMLAPLSALFCEMKNTISLLSQDEFLQKFKNEYDKWCEEYKHIYQIMIIILECEVNISQQIKGMYTKKLNYINKVFLNNKNSINDFLNTFPLPPLSELIENFAKNCESVRGLTGKYFYDPTYSKSFSQLFDTKDTQLALLFKHYENAMKQIQAFFPYERQIEIVIQR